MKYFFLLLLTATILHAAPKHDIVINNRILTTVNGRTISVLDVMKQMDVFLSQYYPEHLNSPEGRMQYYTSQWQQTLQRMIDEELMVADAESKEVKATDAEVREEIQNRYGPNVMGSLDKLGISYEEAKKMIHQEIVVQKIQWLRVTSKVMSNMTTQVVKKEFNDYLTKNPPKDLWTYQFITIRDDDVNHAMQLAEQVAEDPLAAYPEHQGKISVSSELQMEEKDLAQPIREVLSKLTIGSWSQPVIQKSRDGSQVVRIFHLKSHVKQESPLFQTMVAGLKNELMNRYADKEMDLYVTRLHERFNFDQNSLDIPKHFEPFSLR